MKHEMKRKGFTLVELLIVIVVIGVLSAMMMISSTEAVASAKANNVVSNLRNMKTAVLAYYMDHIDAISAQGKDDGKWVSVKINNKDIIPYLSKEKTANLTDAQLEELGKSLNGYWVVCQGGNFYVAADLKHANISNSEAEYERIKDKLSGRKKTTGIQFTDKVTSVTNMDDLKDDPSRFAVMWVR